MEHWWERNSFASERYSSHSEDVDTKALHLCNQEAQNEDGAMMEQFWLCLQNETFIV